MIVSSRFPIMAPTRHFAGGGEHRRIELIGHHPRDFGGV